MSQAAKVLSHKFSLAECI